MSRPVTYPKSRTTTAIRFGEELHDALVAAAADRDISMNLLVNKLCEYGLPRLRPTAPASLFVDDTPVTESLPVTGGPNW